MGSHLIMSGWVAWMVALIGQHPDWAMALVFVTAMAESIAVIGLFIPGTAILVGVGSVAGLGGLGLFPVILFAIVGAVVGDGISYWLGHTFKDQIRGAWPFKKRSHLLAAGEAYFQRHGGKSIFIGRFVPAVRAMVPLVAGIAGMPPRRFYAANILSALLWAPAHILPGAAIAFSLDAYGWPSSRVVGITLAAIALLVLLGWLHRIGRSHRPIR